MKLEGKTKRKLAQGIVKGDTLKGNIEIHLPVDSRIYFYGNDMFAIFPVYKNAGQYIFQYHENKNEKPVEAGTKIDGSPMLAPAQGHWECVEFDDTWEPTIYLEESTITDLEIKSTGKLK
jgi:hypothetical protein